MTNVGVLGVEKVSLFVPGKLIIMAADRQAIVACAYYFVLFIDDASSYLSAGIFASTSREQGNTHKVFVPANVALSFFNSQVSYVGFD